MIKIKYFYLYMILLLINEISNWCLQSKIQQGGQIIEVDYSSDNKIFVVANKINKRINIYNASTYQLLRIITSNRTPMSVKISKNSQWIGIGYFHRRAFIYRAIYPFDELMYFDASDKVIEVDFSYNNTFFMVCSQDQSFEVWKSTDNTTYRIKELKNKGIPHACRFSSNGEVAYSTTDNMVGIYNNVNYAIITQRFFNNDVLEVDFKFNTTTYGTVDEDGSLRFNRNSLIFTDSNDLKTISIGKKKKYYAAAGNTKILFIFNQTDDQIIEKFTDFNGQINSVKISNDEETIIVGDSQGQIRVYKTKCNFQCESGEFINATKCSKCYDAIDSCIICSSTTDCKGCIPGFYLASATSCLPCTNNLTYCIECNGPAECLHCFDGYYLNANKCDSCIILEGCVKCDNSTVCSECYRSDYYLTANFTCEKCSTTLLNCIKCDNSSACSQCKIGFYLPANNTCTLCPNFCLVCLAVDKCTQCKQGYFSNSSNTGICTRCSTVGCLTCNNSNYCFECEQGLFLSGNACILCKNPCSTCFSAATNCTGCLTGYFYTNTNFSCTPCIVNCKICNETGKCLDCFNGFKKDNNSDCKPCADNCSECSTSNCLKCVEMFYLDSFNACVTCISSIYKCLTCSSNLSCTECMNGYYHSGTTGNNSCVECPAGCSECLSGTVCVNCFINYYLSSNVCVPCENNCFECSAQSECISCNIGYYLDNITCKACQTVLNYCTECIDNVTCVSCYPGTFLDSSTYKCKLCQSNCLNCDFVHCFSCETGYFLEMPNTTKICTRCPMVCAECLSLTNCSSCIDGYYFSSSDNKCKKCADLHINCVTCTSSICIQCSRGYELNKTNNNLCSSCQNFISNCDVCFWDNNNSPNPAVKCNSCKYGLIISSNKLQCESCNNLNGCIECKDSTHCIKCEIGFYLKIDSTCNKCSSKCASCSASASCLTCRLGYVFTAATLTCDLCENKIEGCQTCVPSSLNSTTFNCTFCQVGYFLDTTDKKCYICNEQIQGCYICKNASNCSLCLDKYFLNTSLTSNQCVKCVQTLTGCKLCNSSAVCLSCENGYYLDTDEECKFCSENIPGCLYCKDKTQCEECYSGYYLTNGSICKICESSIEGCLYCNNQLVCVQCRTGYFLNTTDKQCYRCNNEGCEVCLERAPSKCATCNSKYFLSGSTCKSCRNLTDYCGLCTGKQCIQCQVGYYLNSTFNCSKCSSILYGCSRCKDQLTCSQCMSSYFLDLSGVCQQCNSVMAGCQYCLNQTNCLACSTNFYLNSTLQVCQPCTDLKGCMLCKDESTCILCQGEYFLNISQCQSCSKQMSNCFSCVSSSICVQCQSGYTLESAKCVAKSVEAQQKIGEEIKLITYYVSSQILRHVLYLKGMTYKKIDPSILNITSNGNTKLLVENFAGIETELTILSYQFGSNDYSLIFFTNNPVNNEINSKNNKMSFRRRLQILDDGFGSLSLDLSVLINMDESVYREIMPDFDYQGAMTVGYSLNSPEFYNSFMESRQEIMVYEIAGIVIIVLFLINYVAKIFFTVPQSKHKSGLLPHILALKSCCLIIFPSFFEYISFCKGLMIIDLPWANKIIAQTFVDLSDIVIQPFGLFFTNLSIAGTFLVGISSYLILKILGQAWFSTVKQIKLQKTDKKEKSQISEIDSQKQVEQQQFQLKKVQKALGVNYNSDDLLSNKYSFELFISSIFSFNVIYYSCVCIEGAFYNPLQLLTINGIFYILGMLLLIYVTIETIYSMIRNTKSINKVRVFLKGIILSLAHFNPIYLISLCFTIDCLLIIFEFLIVYKRNQFTKIIIASHLLCNLSILILIFMPQRLLSLIVTVAFLIICFIIEVYIHVKEYKICKSVEKQKQQ